MTINASILSGTYSYDKFGKPISLNGSLQNGKITLQELDGKGNTTATFVGTLSGDRNEITGVWQNANGNKSLPFALHASSVEDVVGTVHSIRETDFGNFVFRDESSAFGFEDTKQIHVQNAKYVKKTDDSSGDCALVTSIQYGDIIGNNTEQAVVSIATGDMAGNFYTQHVYLYALRNNKVTLLTILQEETVKNDFERFYPDINFFESTPDIQVHEGTVTVRHLIDGAHAGPEKVSSFDYQWDKNRGSLVLRGKPVLHGMEENGNYASFVNFIGLCNAAKSTH